MVKIKSCGTNGTERTIEKYRILFTGKGSYRAVGAFANKKEEGSMEIYKQKQGRGLRTTLFLKKGDYEPSAMRCDLRTR